jgi:hypothetical protein
MKNQTLWEKYFTGDNNVLNDLAIMLESYTPDTQKKDHQEIKNK